MWTLLDGFQHVSHHLGSNEGCFQVSLVKASGKYHTQSLWAVISSPPMTDMHYVLQPQQGRGALGRAQEHYFREQDYVSAHLMPAWVTMRPECFHLLCPSSKVSHFKPISAI